MAGAKWSEHVDDQLDEDLATIVDDVLRSDDFEDVFDELEWGAAARTNLQMNILADETFRRRVRARYDKVVDRATTLDEHVRVAPPWVTNEPWWQERRNRIAFGGLALYLLTFSIGTSWMLFSPTPWLFVTFAGLFMIVMCHIEPITRTLMRMGLPPAIWRRLLWGRHRRKLRWGITRLRYDWKKNVRDDLVLPEIRQRINSGLHRSFSHELTIRDASGLRTANDLSFLITTRAVGQLRRELARLSCGAIALAGRRGVGKTTLLHALETGMLPDIQRADRLTVVVSAPARYELREFVLHLHAVVCRAVLARIGSGTSELYDRWHIHYATAGRHGEWRHLARRFVRATAFVLIGTALGCLIWYRHTTTILKSYPSDLGSVVSRVTGSVDQNPWPTPSSPPAEWYRLAATVVATLFIAAAVMNLIAMVLGPAIRWLAQRGIDLTRGIRVLREWWRASRMRRTAVRLLTEALSFLDVDWRPSTSTPPTIRLRTLTGVDEGMRLPQLNRSVRALALLTTEQLRQIRFLQTHTSGWSGKIDTPSTLGLTVTRTIAHAERPLTQPEVVDQLRGFLDRAATELIRAGEATGITIAIDELDKFADPAQAHEFVNDIKTVFGVHDCVFLVSVSDDALASFERRGIPIRDALDSAFTTMIAVEPFTLEESQQWLDRQVIGLPKPFSCLCHCLSAGVPRELVRAAGSLDDLYRENREIRLQEATWRIISNDVAAKLRAFSHAAQQLPPHQAVSDLIVTLNTVGQLTRSTTDFLPTRLNELAVALRTLDDTLAGPELAKLHHEAASFCYLSATLAELFSDDLDESTLTRICQPASDPQLDVLAAARRALAVEPLLSWSMIDTFRKQENLDVPVLTQRTPGTEVPSAGTQ